jgi:hypothetical protein
MAAPKIDWKVFEVPQEELESELNRLSEDDYDIFSVTFIKAAWTIVAKKARVPSTGKSPMGFSAR